MTDGPTLAKSLLVKLLAVSAVVSVMLICVTVIWEMFTKASTPWWRATAATLTVASR